jgi:hypothetical protein
MEIDMRITRDALLKLTKDTVEKRFAPDRNVTAVFLVGSMRADNAFIGNAADIDLLIIYSGEPPREREIIKLTNEIHIDVVYENARLYAQPRELRGDPWRGWAMWDPILLHQKGRFFEYTQSIVRSQFDDGANVMKRAYAFSAPARTAWNEMLLAPDSLHPARSLSAVANAVNAFAVLTGEPLSERRLLADFPARAQKLGNPELVKLLLGTLGGQVTPDFVHSMLPKWEGSYLAASQNPLDLRLHPARLAYYKSAIEALLEGDFPAAALWPLLVSWSLAADSGGFSDEHTVGWKMTLDKVGLLAPKQESALQALDALLDALEETLEKTAAA